MSDTPPSRSRKYKVSKLTTQASASTDSLPVISIRPRRNDIFIPSVQKSEELGTPRSAVTGDDKSEAGSVISHLSRKLQSAGSKGSPRKKTTRSGSPFKHPVNQTAKGSIGVEVGDEFYADKTNVPSTKLDILESLLPRNLRNPQKFKTQMHHTIRAAQLLEDQNRVNHLSRMLQRDHIQSSSYHPVHYSSGGLSVVTKQTEDDGDTNSLDDSQFESLGGDSAQLRRAVSERSLLASDVRVQSPYDQNMDIKRNIISNRNNHHGRPTLWNPDGPKRPLIAEREERQTMAHFMVDLERSLKEHQEEEDRKQQAEREMIIQLKTINTLFGKNYSLAGALIATAQQLEAEDRQKAIEEAIKRGAELQHQVSTKFHLKHAEGHEGHEGGGGDDEHSVGDDSIGSQDFEMDEKTYHKKLQERALKRAKHALLMAEGHSTRFQSKFNELTDRKMRDKLKNLAKYVGSHTSRKIMDAWNVIEGRFKSSNFTKVVMTPNSAGLLHPVKHQALFLSTLTSLLCSAKVKVGHKELHVLIDKIGGITHEEVFRAREVAALNLVISYDTDCKLRETLGYKKDLQTMMNGAEKLVTLSELFESVFPQEPEIRAEELEKIKNNRQAEIQAVLDEKKKKEEKREAMEKRRLQLIHDFETSLDQYQIMKGKYTRDRHNEFVRLVNHCIRTIAQHYENESAKISIDVMSFIGMDAFPLAIQQKIARHHKPIVALQGQKSNPFLSKRRAATTAEAHESLNTAGVPISAPPGLSSSLGLHLNINVEQIHTDYTLKKEINSVRRNSTATPMSKESPGNAMPLTQAIANIKNAVTAPVEWERLSLHGPPSVVSVLRETISFGKGLNGYPYRDVVACVQYVAVTKMATFFRGHRRKWRYFAARRKWKRIEANIRESHFTAWKFIAVHNVNTNKYCFRKLIAWRYYTKRAIYRRNLFRQCYWLFRTWRKYTDACATAKEKAFFLVHRVMPTVLKIKVFRGWKRYAQLEVKLNRSADNYCAAILHKRYRESFLWFLDWFRRRKHIRKSWFRRGAAMRKVNVYRIRIGPFLQWRIYARYRRLVRHRVANHGYDMKAVVFRGKTPIHAMSFLEQRMLFVRKKLQGDANAKKVADKRKADSKKSKRSSGSRGSASGKKKAHTPNSKSKSSKSGRPELKKTNTATSGAIESDVASAAESAEEATDDDRSASESEGGGPPKPKLKVLPRPFLWKRNFSAMYDIDSEGEDGEDFGSKVVPAHTKAMHHKALIPAPTSFEFIERAETYIQQKAAEYFEVYQLTEVWNGFEAACRFYRVGFRAFNNLRQYAKVKKRVRRHQKKVRHDTLKSYFQMLKVNAKYVARRLAATQMTEAEQLNADVKAHIVGKLNKVRQNTQLVNSTLGRDSDDVELDDETRAIQKMKYLNMISEDNDEEYVAAELQRRKENQAAAKRKAENMKHNVHLPNLLEDDRANREREEQMATKMLEYGRESRKVGLTSTADADEKSREKTEAQNRVLAVVKAQLDSESDVTTSAIDRQDRFVNLFKVHAADNLITILAKVYVQIQVSMMREETRLYFRAMRIPMLLTRSRSMYRRKKLMNWIRICQRLISISRHAHFYAEKRCLWVTLNRWLKYVEIEKMNPTPGLSSMVRRKLMLHPCYTELLDKRGFKKVPYFNNERLAAVATEIPSIFSRWKTETQERILFRVLSEKVHAMFIMKLKQKIFYALKTGFHISEICRLIKQEQPLFPMVRAKADVSIIGRKFLAGRKKTVNATIARYNKKLVHKLKADGKAAMSFKKFMIGFENETSLRISSEQRILSESFEQRGKQEFFDLRVPNRMDPIVPAIMKSMDGRPFSDPQNIASDGKDITIPGGFRLHKLKFVLQGGVGIVGWQIIWAADGTRDIEGPQRGNWNCTAMSMQEFTVPKEDYLAGLEYMYDGGTIVAVRLKYQKNGFTSWAGSKSSLSTLSVFLGAEIAPKLLFENDRDRYMDPEEVAHPAYPSHFVIGLTGIVCGGRATCLGLVVRKIKKQNIFSYYYVGDVLARVNAHKNDFSQLNLRRHRKRKGDDDSQAGGSVDGSSVGGGSSVQESQATEDTSTVDDNDLDSVGSDGSHTTVPKKKEGGEGEGEEGENSEEILPEEILMLGKRRHGVLKQRTDDEPLSRSEEEFFDVLRMRTTELSDALEKVVEFAKRLWTSKEIRMNPVLNRLISVRIISHLSHWYFNVLSKRLIQVSQTEKQALVLQKTARQYQFQAIKLTRRAEATLLQARLLEKTKQPWHGKTMLGPVERQAKKDHQARVSGLKDLAKKYDDESFEMRQQVLDYEKEAYGLMPRIILSQYVFNNYKVKIAAARHKASLLERMTLEDIKSGLFGTDTKDNLRNKEQMNAIHSSLMNQKIVLSDQTSLSRLVEDVLAEEGAILDQEQEQARRQAARLHQRNRGAPRLSTVTANSASLSLNSTADLPLKGQVSGIALTDSEDEFGKSTKHHSGHKGHGHGHSHSHSGKHHHASGGHVHHKIKHHASKNHSSGGGGGGNIGSLDHRERSLTLNSVDTGIELTAELPGTPLGGTPSGASSAKHSSHSSRASGSSAHRGAVLGSPSAVQMSKSGKY